MIKLCPHRYNRLVHDSNPATGRVLPAELPAEMNKAMNVLPESARAWVQNWLTRAAITLTGASPLRVEASHRKFFRLKLDGASAPATCVLMESPPALERNDAFVDLRAVFAAAGVPVPDLMAAETGAGLFLLEDFGATHLDAAYGTADESRAVHLAIDQLHALARVEADVIPPYTTQRFRDELDLFDEWLVQGLLGERSRAQALRKAYEALIDATQAQPLCCVHRDYHCRNLLLPPHGVGLGIVDFQDALRGPRLYDIASLLRDCYHCFSEAAVARYFAYFLSGADDLDNRSPASWQRLMDLTALQRQLKALGIFARLALRDGRNSHLSHVVPVLERIAALAATHAETTTIAGVAAELLPALRAHPAIAAAQRPH